MTRSVRLVPWLLPLYLWCGRAGRQGRGHRRRRRDRTPPEIRASCWSRHSGRSPRSACPWLDSPDALDELRKRGDAAAGLMPVVVLVGGVVAVLGQREA